MDKPARLNQEQFLQCVRNHRDLNEILHKQKDHSSQELFDDIERVAQNESHSSKASQESKPNNDVLDRAINMFAEPKVIFYERQESLASDHMMEEISKVFHNKSFEQKGGSHLSTEMSNEPGMQRGSSVLSLLTSGSETERRKRKTIAEEDSHYFVISLDKIRDYQDDRTTIMIKNIPNKYTVQMLQDLINQSHRNAYDFLYLPIDFKVLFTQTRINAIWDMHSQISFIPVTLCNFIGISMIKDGLISTVRRQDVHKNKDMRVTLCQDTGQIGFGAALPILECDESESTPFAQVQDKKLKPVIVPQSELSRIHQIIQRQKQ